MNQIELQNLLIEIQDFLVPKLDTYEQAIYRYIFRHTILVGKTEMIFSTRAAEIGYGQGINNRKPSGTQRSKKLRSLERKEAIKIIDRSHLGIKVRINLPNEINGLISEKIEVDLNLEDLDFYKDKRLLKSILERENYKCFYTGRKINETNCYLDHLIPQSMGGTNKYSNIVACCYDANSMKSDKEVSQFTRELYREGIISLNEFNDLKVKIENLQKGELKPNLEEIKKEIFS